MSHPFAAEIEVISTALISGMADNEGMAPSHLKLNFEDPMSEGSEGVATLRFADWKTENQGVLYIPFAVEEDNSAWQAYFGDDIVPVTARLYVRDILGRGIAYHTASGKKFTPYMQYDVVEQGVVFTAQPVGEEAGDRQFGAYDGKTYDRITEIARRQTSLDAILDLALRY